MDHVLAPQLPHRRLLVEELDGLGLARRARCAHLALLRSCIQVVSARAVLALAVGAGAAVADLFLTIRASCATGADAGLEERVGAAHVSAAVRGGRALHRRALAGSACQANLALPGRSVEVRAGDAGSAGAVGFLAARAGLLLARGAGCAGVAGAGALGGLIRAGRAVAARSVGRGVFSRRALSVGLNAGTARTLPAVSQCTDAAGRRGGRRDARGRVASSAGLALHGHVTQLGVAPFSMVGHA